MSCCKCPVLFFSGNGNPLPEGDEQRKRLAENLRDYIDRGGFIFADGGEACADEEGDRRVRQGVSPTDGPRLSEARISLQTVGCLAPGLVRRPADKSRSDPLAAGHRLRLPHQRYLCAVRS